MPASSDDITLAVLAGGEGSRMGRPKGLLRLGGRPILSRLHERLAWTGPTLLVTAPGREHPPGCDAFTREVVDPVAGLGPLRGVLTALENATTRLVLIATVDMPALTPQQLVFLVESAERVPAALGLFLRRPVDGQAQLEPFPSAFRLAAAPVLADQLAHDRRAVHRLAHDPRFQTIDAPSHWRDDIWTNLNEPAELHRYEASL